MMPALFVAHGAPTLAIENNEYTEFLRGIAATIPKPKAIVVFTAHWESTVQQIGVASEHTMMYDFGGFPQEMYEMVYPAIGDPELAAEIRELWKSHGIDSSAIAVRGLDHGVWVPLQLMYPSADIPVIPISVNPVLTPAEQYRIGQSLESLRERGVLIIASGGTVHNLSRLSRSSSSMNTKTVEWAVGFDDWLESRLLAWNTNELFRYQQLAPFANEAVPPYGKEHFVPLFYAMGAANNTKSAQLLHRSYQYGSLSLCTWRFD